VEVVPGGLGVFEPEKKFGTDDGSSDGGGNYRPTDWRGERIAEAAAEGEVEAEGDEIGESFEENVRVNRVSAKVEVDGEVGSGME
jgi:hypothetical protein